MPLLGSPDQMTEDQKAVVKLVTDRFNAADRFKRPLTDKWNVWYGLSRNYRRLQQRHAQATTPNDKDTVIQEFRRVFGEELFVPYIYTVIETTLPRILADGPKVNVKPNDPREETYAACEPLKRLYERDNARMRYATRLQETARSGLRYGLGVQKSYWMKKTRSGNRVAPKESEAGFKLVQDNQIVVFEGPAVEPVDIFDFFWDPVGHDLDSCSYVIHRTWRSMEYIEQKVAEGKERRANGENGGWAELDLEAVKGMGSKSGRGDVWADRMLASGMSDYQTEGNELHEVWEYHDRQKVYTVLDRALLVQDSLNPFLHGDFPFQIFRPTIVEHEFCGVGEAEPIAHLQYELNTMRGQRRDAATLAMNRGYFYSQGMLNPAKVLAGAGVFVPVQGDPKDVIYPMPFTDLPASGVSEEEALKRDIEMTTGISESTIGSSGEETATGTQLVQAAANQRIRQKAKNLFHDLLRPEVEQRRELYRQNITTEDQGQVIRVEDKRTPTGFVFVPCGPKEINANVDVEPMDGSTEPDNTAQKRSDAVQLVDAMTPFIDRIDTTKFVTYVLEAFGVDLPEELLKPPGPAPEEIVHAIGSSLQEAGIPQDFIEQVLQTALKRLQEGPQPGEEGASQNGAAQEPVPAGG